MIPRLVIPFTLIVLPTLAWGQIVRGSALEDESGRPIESGVVTLLAANDEPIRAVLTDSLGNFGVRAPQPGAYRLRFERLGFRPVTTDRFTLDEGETETRTLRAAMVSVSLERIVVTDNPRCRVLREADTLTARVWSSVRGVLASAAAGEIGWYPYVTIERYERDYDYRRRLVTRERKWTSTGASTSPFVALPAAELERHGFIMRGRGDSVVYYAPEARTLIADEFLRTHCFRVRDDRTERGRVGLDIEPVPGRRRPEIKGTLWVDAASGELRRLDFTYVNIPQDVVRENAEGWVEFRRLPRGAWVVDQWALRLPLVGKPPPQSVYGTGVPVAGERSADRPTELLGTHEEGGRIVSLESARPRRASAPTTTVAVRGMVRSSTGVPVAGARAFLSGTGHSSVTDREGEYAMLDVPVGRYRLSFTHPRFDTLGVVGPVVDVDADAAREHELRMPSDDEIARSACAAQGTEASAQPATLLYGYVRDGDSPAVVPEATVTVAWRVSIPRGPTVGVREQTLEVHADASGSYQVCGVPRDIQLSVRAARGSRRGTEHRIEPISLPVTRVDVALPRAR
ncbi:MAG TPA: carboxypeptidase-like regulatory domain-containing protein [Candidatus Limnocylindria bacterium]|nr:carboxypeptidase-like regulatory domain-containing protein [Candidatus Limnocylindria bacterium]